MKKNIMGEHMGIPVYSRVEYYGRKSRSLMYLGNNGVVVETPKLKPYAFIVLKPELISKATANKIELEDVDYRDEYGNRVVKYMVDTSPKKIAEYRDRLFGYDNTREADIRYVIVLYKDYYYDVAYSMENIAYIDIEADDSEGFPQPSRNKILCITVKPHGRKPVWFYIDDYDSERQMIQEMIQTLEEKKLTLLVGWNINFDYSYLTERMKRLGIRNRYWQLVIPIDLHDLYKADVKGLSAYTLLEVAEYEKLEGYPIKKAAEGKRVYMMTRKQLMEYNVNDAAMLQEIEDKYGFIETQITLSRLVNIPLDQMTPITRADVAILRRMRELGYVAVNRRRIKPKPYKGAIVLKPPAPGLYRNIVELDFESMYPNIIIYEKIDVGRFKGEVLPYILKQLLEERRRYKKLYKETGDKKYDIMQKALKIFMNSCYGAFGQPYFRYYDYEKAEAVTRKGRQLLQLVRQFLEDHGYPVLYGDTDSIFVQIPDAETKEELVEYGKMLGGLVDLVIEPYHIKYEAAGDILFLKKANSSDPAKKRYILKTIDDEWIIRGIELRRSDWDALTKEVVWRVVEMIFQGKSREDVKKYLTEVRKKMYSGEYDDKLIISKSIDVGKEYKVKAEHVRAYKKLVKRIGSPIKIDRIMYVYVGGDVEPLLTEAEIEKYRRRLNYRKYWRKLENAVNRVINSAYVNVQQRTLWR